VGSGDFVISEMPWLVSDGLRCPMPATTESSCASLRRNGERWSGRWRRSIPSRPVGPRWQSGSATSSWPTPESFSASPSLAQLYVMRRVGFQTGNVGVSPALCAERPLVAVENTDAQKPHRQRLSRPKGENPPSGSPQHNTRKPKAGNKNRTLRKMLTQVPNPNGGSSTPSLRRPKSMALAGCGPSHDPERKQALPSPDGQGATLGGAAAHNVDGAPASTDSLRTIGPLCQHAAHNVDSSLSYHALPELRSLSDDFNIKNKKEEGNPD
jgi:hypothetical protein